MRVSTFLSLQAHGGLLSSVCWGLLPLYSWRRLFGSCVSCHLTGGLPLKGGSLFDALHNLGSWKNRPLSRLVSTALCWFKERNRNQHVLTYAYCKYRKKTYNRNRMTSSAMEKAIMAFKSDVWSKAWCGRLRFEEEACWLRQLPGPKLLPAGLFSKAAHAQISLSISAPAVL